MVDRRVTNLSILNNSHEHVQQQHNSSVNDNIDHEKQKKIDTQKAKHIQNVKKNDDLKRKPNR